MILNGLHARRASCSPYLNHPEFYLWGYLKDNVKQTIPKLKTAISAKIRRIPWEERFRAIDNFARRIQVCFQRRGGHLEHIMNGGKTRTGGHSSLKLSGYVRHRLTLICTNFSLTTTKLSVLHMFS